MVLKNFVYQYVSTNSFSSVCTITRKNGKIIIEMIIIIIIIIIIIRRRNLNLLARMGWDKAGQCGIMNQY